MTNNKREIKSANQELDFIQHFGISSQLSIELNR